MPRKIGKVVIGFYLLSYCVYASVSLYGMCSFPFIRQESKYNAPVSVTGQRQWHYRLWYNIILGVFKNFDTFIPLSAADPADFPSVSI
jgi:hypothetical protein